MTANGRGNPTGAASRAVITVSTLPGRLRIRASAIRDQPMLATISSTALAAHGAVQRVLDERPDGRRARALRSGRHRAAPAARRHPPLPRRGRRAATASPAAAAPWHAAPTPRVVTRLRTSRERGLSSAEAARRLAEFGANRLPAPQPKSAAEIVTGHLTSLPVVLLGGAAALSLAGGALVDAAVILGVVAANTVVGYLTESRVERTIAALADTAPPQAVVRRDGREIVAPAAALVPGDVLVLRSGAEVVADARILEASGLAMDQSALTGESQPVPRSAAPVAAAAVVSERDSMVFAGTRVVEGRGLAVVTATGLQTEIGGVRALDRRDPIAGHAARTPARRGRAEPWSGVSLGLCGLTLGLGWLRGVPLLEMARSAISLAVAAVPEGLPAVATTTLALGMQRMMRQGMLVRRLSAVESLGATTVVCADKTGTLTENRMSVDVLVPGRAGVRQRQRRRARPRSRPGPGAQRSACCATRPISARQRGPRQLHGGRAAPRRARGRHRLPRGAGQPPPAARARRGNGANWMATVHGTGPRPPPGGGEGRARSRSSASPTAGSTARRSTPLDEERRREVLHANARMAARGLRVLALAYREDDGTGEPAFRDLVCVGLVGLTDPVRPGVRRGRSTRSGARASGR